MVDRLTAGDICHLSKTNWKANWKLYCRKYANSSTFHLCFLLHFFLVGLAALQASARHGLSRKSKGPWRKCTVKAFVVREKSTKPVTNKTKSHTLNQKTLELFSISIPYVFQMFLSTSLLQRLNFGQDSFLGVMSVLEQLLFFCRLPYSCCKREFRELFIRQGGPLTVILTFGNGVSHIFSWSLHGAVEGLHEPFLSKELEGPPFAKPETDAVLQ